MLSNKDLYQEIGEMDAIIEKKDKIDDDTFKRSMLKSQTLILKLLHNQRTNMVLAMKKLGVEFPKREEVE